MVSQYRGDPFGTRVYGGGPPPPVPGVKVIGLEALGEQDGGDFEARHRPHGRDGRGRASPAKPFDVLHAQYGYPTGWAVLLASRRLGRAERGLHPGRRRALGRLLLRDAPPRHAPRARPRQRAPDRRGVVPGRGLRPARLRPRPLHHRARAPSTPRRFTPAQGARARRRGLASAPALPRPRRPPERRARLPRRPRPPARARRAVRGHRSPASARTWRRAGEKAAALGLSPRRGPLHRLRRLRGARPDLYRRGRRVRLADLRRGLLQHDPGGDGRRPARGLHRHRRRRPTACATARTGCWSQPGDVPALADALARIIGDERAAPPHRRARRWRSAAASTRGARSGARSWTSTSASAPSAPTGLRPGPAHAPLPVSGRAAPALGWLRCPSPSPCRRISTTPPSPAAARSRSWRGGAGGSCSARFSRASVDEPDRLRARLPDRQGLGPGGRLHGAAPGRGPRPRRRRSGSSRRSGCRSAEAPHRGYGSALALFAGVRPSDAIDGAFAEALSAVLARRRAPTFSSPRRRSAGMSTTSRSSARSGRPNPPSPCCSGATFPMPSERRTRPSRSGPRWSGCILCGSR